MLDVIRHMRRNRGPRDIGPRFRREADGQVRITGLTPPISAALQVGLLEQRPQQWELDRHRFAVVDVICDAATNDWTGQTSYEHLAARHLLASEQLPRTVELEFASPTAFHSKGATMPVPLPELVFGSLVDRWNAFSPITLSPSVSINW